MTDCKLISKQWIYLFLWTILSICSPPTVGIPQNISPIVRQNEQDTLLPNFYHWMERNSYICEAGAVFLSEPEAVQFDCAALCGEPMETFTACARKEISEEPSCEPVPELCIKEFIQEFALAVGETRKEIFLQDFSLSQLLSQQVGKSVEQLAVSTPQTPTTITAAPIISRMSRPSSETTTPSITATNSPTTSSTAISTSTASSTTNTTSTTTTNTTNNFSIATMTKTPGTTTFLTTSTSTSPMLSTSTATTTTTSTFTTPSTTNSSAPTKASITMASTSTSISAFIPTTTTTTSSSSTTPTAFTTPIPKPTFRAVKSSFSTAGVLTTESTTSPVENTSNTSIAPINSIGSVAQIVDGEVPANNLTVLGTEGRDRKDVIGRLSEKFKAVITKPIEPLFENLLRGKLLTSNRKKGCPPDGDVSCEFWARVGECLQNPRYMLTICKRACRVCQPQKSIQDEIRVS